MQNTHKTLSNKKHFEVCKIHFIYSEYEIKTNIYSVL